MLGSYLGTLGHALDCFLNACFGGKEDQTISRRAALSKWAGDTSGCVVCAWLHWTLRQHHCTRVLRGEPLGSYALAVAGVQLVALFVALFYVVPWLLLWWARCV